MFRTYGVALLFAGYLYNEFKGLDSAFFFDHPIQHLYAA
jgi:hypothetical protein